MAKGLVSALPMVLCGHAEGTEGQDRGYHLIAGSVDVAASPDGNSVFLEAPEGLILVDTGRHPGHSGLLLQYARKQARPIAAIINTHWHLDHTTGNADVRRAFPEAAVYASRVIEGTLAGMLDETRRAAEARLAAGQLSPERLARARRFLSARADPRILRPTRVVTHSANVEIAGRSLRLNPAESAVTAATCGFTILIPGWWSPVTSW